MLHFRLFRFLTTLVLALALGLGSVVHASEALEGIDPGCAGTATAQHHANDGDQVQQDAASGVPHHHTECHCHSVGVPSAAGPTLALRAIPAQRPAASPPATPRAARAPDPRPPRA